MRNGEEGGEVVSFFLSSSFLSPFISWNHSRRTGDTGPHSLATRLTRACLLHEATLQPHAGWWHPQPLDGTGIRKGRRVGWVEGGGQSISFLPPNILESGENALGNSHGRLQAPEQHA